MMDTVCHILGFLASIPILFSGCFHKPAEVNVLVIVTCLLLGLFFGNLLSRIVRPEENDWDAFWEVFGSWAIFSACGMVIWPIVDHFRI